MAYFNNQIADLIRDCSKSRPTTFSELIYPITLDIEAKIKFKNNLLRNKARARLEKRQNYSKNEEFKEELSLSRK